MRLSLVFREEEGLEQQVDSVWFVQMKARFRVLHRKFELVVPVHHLEYWPPKMMLRTEWETRRIRKVSWYLFDSVGVLVAPCLVAVIDDIEQGLTNDSSTSSC